MRFATHGESIVPAERLDAPRCAICRLPHIPTFEPGARVPTYEYRCRGCRHAFERFQRMSDPPVHICPSCGENRVERLISTGGGIVFKGAGFYATDYRQPRNGGDKSEETRPSKDASSGSDGAASASDGAASGSDGAASASSEGESGS